MQSAKGLSVCPEVLTERGAFFHAVAEGKVARELEPGGKAAAEIAAVWGWLCLQADMKTCKHVSTREGGQ
jgi:chromosome partitioning protein